MKKFKLVKLDDIEIEFLKNLCKDYMESDNDKDCGLARTLF